MAVNARELELRRVQQSAYHAGRSVGLAEDDAQDAASEYLLRWLVAENCGSALARSGDAAWIEACARNHALDWSRRQRRHRRPSEECEAAAYDTCARAAVRSSALEMLMGAIGSLRPDAQALLLGHCVDGHTVRVLAEQAGITEKTAEHRIRRARASVRDYLESHGWPEADLLAEAYDEA